MSSLPHGSAKIVTLPAPPAGLCQIDLERSPILLQRPDSIARLDRQDCPSFHEVVAGHWVADQMYGRQDGSTSQPMPVHCGAEGLFASHNALVTASEMNASGLGDADDLSTTSAWSRPPRWHIRLGQV